MIKEFRVLSPEDLRNCCIANEWYTKGTSEEYKNLFAKVSTKGGNHKNITTEVLKDIAQDIILHSDLEGMDLPTVMCEVCRFTFTFFKEA